MLPAFKRAIETTTSIFALVHAPKHSPENLNLNAEIRWTDGKTNVGKPVCITFGVLVGSRAIHKRPSLMHARSSAAGELPFCVSKTIANCGGKEEVDIIHLPSNMTLSICHGEQWTICHLVNLGRRAAAVIQLFPSRVPPSCCSHCLPVIIVIICCKLVLHVLYGDFYPHSSRRSFGRSVVVAAEQSSTGILFPQAKRRARR